MKTEDKLITIVGVGALGSHVAMFLRNVPDSLRIIDFDRVEQKNTASQFHGKAAVGKLKVQGLQMTMDFLWGAKLKVIPHKLTKDNDAQLLLGSKLIIDCLDNGAARRLVQDYARRTGTPCLHGALAADGSFGRVIWDDKFVIDDESGHGAPTCEDGQQLPFIAMTSAFLARSAQAFLTDNRQNSFHIFPKGAILV